jgi:protein-disulfide isomerase
VKKNKKSPMKTIVIGTLVMLTLLAIIVISIQNFTKTKSYEAHPNLKSQPTQGKTTAPINIVEFGDYKCPSCKVWGEQIYPLIKKNYIDTGKVKFSYVNVLFHGQESKLAALAAESVWKQDQQAYWVFHKELFNAQPIEDHDTMWITPDKIIKIARTYTPTINLQQLQTVMQNQIALAEVNKDEELVKVYNISQTPTI